MNIICDGRRMTKRQADALAAALFEADLLAVLRQQGYSMAPARAPRGRSNGDVVLRTVWTRREQAAVTTIRISVKLIAPPGL